LSSAQLKREFVGGRVGAAEAGRRRPDEREHGGAVVELAVDRARVRVYQELVRVEA
jgi:hypothetical protein